MAKDELKKRIAYEYEDDDVSDFTLTFKFDISNRLLQTIFNHTRVGLQRKGLSLPEDAAKEGYTEIVIIPQYYGTILTSLLKSMHDVEKEVNRTFYTRHVEHAGFYMEGKKWHVRAIIKGTFLIRTKP